MAASAWMCPLAGLRRATVTTSQRAFFIPARVPNGRKPRGLHAHARYEDTICGHCSLLQHLARANARRRHSRTRPASILELWSEP